MKVVAAALAALSLLRSRGCHASPLLRADGETEEVDRRKLQISNHAAMSSPLNYHYESLAWPDNESKYNILVPELFLPNGNVCYNEVLSDVAGGPTTAQLLVMFSDKFVEHKGSVFGIPNYNFNYGIPNDFGPAGLYEVINRGGSCVEFHLLHQGYIREIVASSRFDPIEIIGVAGEWPYKIYGYYPDPDPHAGGAWSRKPTVWGTPYPYGTDGNTLVAEPVYEGEAASVAGLSETGGLFHLWGDFDNFNYDPDRGGIQCAAPPAIIDDWTGVYAGSRGTYCPAESNNQLQKWTWHSSGGIKTDLGWEPAERIGRLSPSSNIYGVSTNGNLLHLWNDSGEIKSAALNFPELTQVRSVGGINEAHDGKGFFASNSQHRVFNVYWESGAWRTKEFSMPQDWNYGVANEFFGNYKGKTYLLYGHPQKYDRWPRTETWFRLYRFDFVGGQDRYTKQVMGSGSLEMWDGN